MKLLVLDMDGVVNSNDLIYKWISDKQASYVKKYPEWSKQKVEGYTMKAFRKAFNNSTELIFPELADRISRIVTNTGCSILWSSSWRCLGKYKNIDKARQMFDKRGLPGDALIGYTPDSRGYWERGTEIRKGIEIQGNVTKAAVIDDLAEAGEDLPACAKFFQTSERTGITEEIYNNIVAYLQEDK